MAQTYTLHQLRELTIADLRAIAKDIQHEAVQGYSQMNKEHLLPAICQALGVDTTEHHTVVGVDKGAIKARMLELKQKRVEALDRGDHEALRQIRRERHHYNHRLRSHMQ